MKLLEVKGLSTSFAVEGGRAIAVRGISLDLGEGETLGIVGESGCGKTVTALSILRLIQDPPGRIDSGEILFEGHDILKMSPAELRGLRGNRIAMIFQEPMTSLNPVFTVGEQIAEAVRLHQKLDRKSAALKAIDMIRQVGISEPERRAVEYPHQLSGGMRQRIMIAMALSCNPKILIADEPTTALDVTVQAQILDLMRGLKEKFGAAIILITHDMGVIATVADRVAVMYGGRIVELGPVRELFKNPKHPYTVGLLASLPKLDTAHGKQRLREIPGVVPSPADFPAGCSFHPRCSKAIPQCVSGDPALKELSPGHHAACWLY